MRIKSKYVKTKYPQLRLAKLLLLVTSVVLLIANITLMKETRILAKSYSAQQNQATWFLFQLTKELSELLAETSHVGDGDKHLKRVWLKYDITWSRFDLVLNNKESSHFMDMTNTRQFFEELFIEFKSLEALLKTVTDDDPVTGSVFHAEVKRVYMKMIGYVNRNFRVNSPLYTAQQSKAQQLQSLQLMAFVGFMFCLMLISVVFYKESRFHHKLAMTDTLTNLGNRLALFTKMQHLHNAQKDFTLYLLDLDGFKSINDQYGHQEGDKVLIELSEHIREFDCENYRAYRIGGDEFAIVHRYCSQKNETGVVEHIEKVHEYPGSRFAKTPLLGVSVGVATFPKDAQDIDELISIADKRMYQMKFYHKQDKQALKKQV